MRDPARILPIGNYSDMTQISAKGRIESATERIKHDQNQNPVVKGGSHVVADSAVSNLSGMAHHHVELARASVGVSVSLVSLGKSVRHFLTIHLYKN